MRIENHSPRPRYLAVLLFTALLAGFQHFALVGQALEFGRQVHFADMHVAQFVEQNKEHIAGDELHPIDALTLGEILEAWIVPKRRSNLVDPLLERW